jgi:type III secretory pathway component EscS
MVETTQNYKSLHIVLFLNACPPVVANVIGVPLLWFIPN